MSPEQQGSSSFPSGGNDYVRVYAIGEIDYDVRRELPAAVFSTLGAAKAYAGPNVIWEAEDGWWFGRHGDHEWAVAAYVVDAPTD